MVIGVAALYTLEYWPQKLMPIEFTVRQCRLTPTKTMSYCNHFLTLPLLGVVPEQCLVK